MTSRPHDALFKGRFENPSHLGGLYRGSYPPAIHDQVDWSSTRPEPGSFIDNQLGDTHTDLLFSARLRGAAGEERAKQILLYLLLEHQSSNDDDMPLRMYAYLGQIYRRHRELNGRPLAHVLPLIVTHAPDGWTAPCSFGALFEPPAANVEGLTELTPQFAIKVLDLSQLTNQEIEERGTSVVAKLVLWLLRDGRNVTRLLSNVGYWSRAVIEALHSPSGDAIIAQLLRYVYEITDGLHYEQFRETIHQQIPDAERVTMTMAEELMQQGRQEGRQEGLLEGLLEGRLRQLEELLTLKFGELHAEHRTRLASATEPQLSALARRILTADSLEAVFAEL